MPEFNVRQRAGLIAVVVILFAIGSWGWWRNAAAAAKPTSMLESTALPPGAVEIEAGEPPSDAPSSEATAPSPDIATEPAAKPKVLVVYVTGAVNRPGVYTLKPGDRIYKAIQAAGGFKKNAANESLNLADFLQDGDQLNVPTRSALTDASKPPVRPAVTAAARPVTSPAPRTAPAEPRRARVLGAPPVPPAPVAAAPSGLATQAGAPDGGSAASKPAGPEKLRTPGEGTVNINTANLEELTRLPGVGPSTAQKILDYRQQIGRFSSPEQLLDVRGIGEKKLAAILPFVRLE